MAETFHILVFRFSALGDVAMTVPVLRNLLHQYPHLHVTFVSDPFTEPLFTDIERLQFVGADTRTIYKGLAGLSRLSRELKNRFAFDAIADLHNVLRTKVVRLFLSRKPSAVIDKGRAEKKELTRSIDKKLRPLKTNFERYAAVFEKLGYPIKLDYNTGLSKPQPATGLVPGPTGSKKLIGIAPFARHLPKMYPLEKMKKVVDLLSAREDVTIILFASKREAAMLSGWQSAHVYPVAGTLSFANELNLISQLNVMLSMDSANMHLASMFGVTVVSVWGATHPYLGFLGWGQLMDHVIQLDLPCRPSSVFGNKPCPLHGEQGCMDGIEPMLITTHVLKVVAGSAV